MKSRITLVAGLGFGDEGKGTTVDWLARTQGAALVVRYNGGAQAAHNVVTPDGRHHTFAQIGAAAFAGVPTLLSRYVLVNPLFLLAEARALAAVAGGEPLAHVAVEDGALVTTPYHVATNRLREMARSARHGSCGMGIGETMADSLEHPDEVLRMGDLVDLERTREKLAAVRAWKLRALAAFVDGLPVSAAIDRELGVLADDSLADDLAHRYLAFARSVRIVGPEHLAAVLARPDAHVIFEGAQGVLLDQDLGFHPHTTWTDTTFGNARALLREAGHGGPVTRLGIVRAYATRHGAGPFPTEDPAFDRLSEHDHNRWGEWQGSFRSGAADEPLLRYAARVIGGVDAIVVTNLDRLALLGDTAPVAVAHEHAGTCRAALPTRTPPLAPTLEHQEALGRELAASRPIVEHVPIGSTHRALAYAERLAAAAGAPLAAASFGPTSGEKVDRFSKISPGDAAPALG